jgi:uncharacterized damage-inducible protein DinB
MRRIYLLSLGVAMIALGFAASSRAQAAPPAAPAAPASGARAEFLDYVDYFQQRYVSLAEAVPADKYTWRPGEGVRSISEVFLHVAGANFNLPRLIGTQPPATFDAKGYDKSTTDKAKVVQALKDSFAHLRKAVLTMSDADLDKTTKLRGKDQSYRYVLFFMTSHLGEHLGQSIAYARINGVVPPWTEEQLKQQQKPAVSVRLADNSATCRLIGHLGDRGAANLALGDARRVEIGHAARRPLHLGRANHERQAVDVRTRDQRRTEQRRHHEQKREETADAHEAHVTLLPL